MSTATQPPRERRALIVEDLVDFQEMFRSALALVGPDWALDCHGTARGALSALERPGPALDLVVVDLGLPDMSGLAVIQEARRRLPEVPVLVASIFDDETNVLAAIHAGARGYVLKGDAPEAMAHAIGQILDGVYPLSPALARHLFKLAGGAPPGGASSIRLTNRELELLRLLSRGVTYEEAASAMGVTLSTVRHHVCNLYDKLEVDSKVSAIAKARETGWL